MSLQGGKKYVAFFKYSDYSNEPLNLRGSTSAPKSNRRARCFSQYLWKRLLLVRGPQITKRLLKCKRNKTTHKNKETRKSKCLASCHFKRSQVTAGCSNCLLPSRGCGKSLLSKALYEPTTQINARFSLHGFSQKQPKLLSDCHRPTLALW